MRRLPAGECRRDQGPQIPWKSRGVKQPVPDEGHQVRELGFRQHDRRPEQVVEPREHRRDRTGRTLQVGRERRGGPVAADPVASMW